MNEKTMKTMLLQLFLVLGILFPLGLHAQQINVRGTVSDQSNEPVIGASIAVKGGNTGAVTDIDGKFSIQTDANSTLTVSFLGYKTMTVPVNGRTMIDVVLTEDNAQLDEVVVIGYGTMKKGDLTGAVSSLGNKDFGNRPVSNIGEAMQGKLAGVQVMDAGKPGDNGTIKVRGLGSINNSDPLVVIDGVPTDLGINAVNMADIDRLDVLKDASATAIYGSRGANGVIMITTKKGESGKSGLSLSANASMQNVTHVPTLLNASEYAALSNDMMLNSGRVPNPDFADPQSLGVGTNWTDELFKTGFMQNYTLSYFGGNDKSHYYVSGGFLDQTGDRKSTRLNSSH